MGEDSPPGPETEGPLLGDQKEVGGGRQSLPVPHLVLCGVGISSLGIGEAIYLRGHRVESIGARTKEKQSVKGSNSTADTERVLVTGVGLDAA